MSDAVALTEAESDLILRNLQLWEKPTAEQVRNVILAGHILCPTDPGNQLDRFLTSLSDMAIEATKAGTLFDLGYMPNAVLSSEAHRAAPLIAHGHIGHPYRAPYLLFHTWSDANLNEGGKTVGSVYFIDPADCHEREPRFPPGTFLAAEFQCTKILGEPWLVLCDAAAAAVVMRDGKTAYHGSFKRSAIREALPPELNLSDGDVVCNLFDPITACLLLLATDGVAVERIAAPDKLNKHRAKANKPLIPPHWRVLTGPYVTALSQRGRRSEQTSGDGHHASPVPHLRRGHIRHLHARHGGGTTWVRDALVMIKDGQEMHQQIGRSFYQFRREEVLS